MSFLVDVFVRCATAWMPAYWRDGFRIKLISNYTILAPRGRASCPFMGGTLHCEHSAVTNKLIASAALHATGAVRRDTYLGGAELSTSMFLGTPLVGCAAPLHQTLRPFYETTFAWSHPTNIDVPGRMATLFASGSVEPTSHELKVFWLQLLFDLLGLETLRADEAARLADFQTRFLNRAVFLPDWTHRLPVSISDWLTMRHETQTWAVRIGRGKSWTELQTKWVQETVILAGGLAIPIVFASILQRVRSEGVEVTTANALAFVYEVLRVHPPVSTFSYRTAGAAKHILGLANALVDPAVWGPDPRAFRVRELDVYQQYFVGFAEPAVATTTDPRDDRVCPGKDMALYVLSQFAIVAWQAHRDRRPPPPPQAVPARARPSQNYYIDL